MNNHPRKRVKTPVRVTKAPLKSEVSGTPGSLDKPNIDDPLSEPTRHRRVWAAYLSRGFTRRQFAHALGTNYHTVNRWDAGAAAISLDMLERASALLNYSMDELCFGRRSARLSAVPPAAAPAAASAPAAPAAARQPARAGVLDEADIRRLFDAQHVDPVTRAAFGEHTVSPAGRYQTFTAEYIATWCAAYAITHNEHAALAAGVNARAVSEAVAAGVGTVTADALRAAALRQKP
jgi:transcriptional regulator with XRE-family HTH domain